MYAREEDPTSIAIIGMAIRTPGAGSVEEFWEKVKAGEEMIGERPGVSHVAVSDKGKYFNVNTKIGNGRSFDASFFGVMPNEADLTDPQQRVFLECAWSALEDAGYHAQEYHGIIGLFAGAYLNSYLLNNVLPSVPVDNYFGNVQTMIANEKDHIATMTAYKLNLTGPAVNVQTSCSSSLTAVHLACESLLSFSCDMVLAGAATVGAAEEGGYYYQDSGLLSKDGHLRPFDKDATGTVYSEGVGVVVLKRLADAVEDGDHIFAVIKGSAINNDGSAKIGYSAPSVKGQAEVIRRVHSMAGVRPEMISFIEAHGTGTPLGDSIELEALHTVFGEGGAKTGFCALGSVKGNIGHTGPVSGVIGLIKAALSLYERCIPPVCNCVHPHDRIDPFGSPFYVNPYIERWDVHEGAKLAGVSSFGIGGTNVHVILESAPEYREVPEQEQRERVFAMSAQSVAALREMQENMLVFLGKHPGVSLDDLAYTLQVGRKDFEYKYCCVFCSHRELTEKLAHAVAGETIARPNPMMLALYLDPSAHVSNERMALFEKETAFRKAYAEASKALARGGPSENRSGATEAFCAQYALCRLLLAWHVNIRLFYADALEGATRDCFLRLPSAQLTDGQKQYGMDGDNIKCVTLSGLLAGGDGAETLYELLARLWREGCVPSWPPCCEGKKRRRISLPTYPFQRELHWIEAAPKASVERADVRYTILPEDQLLNYTAPKGFIERELARIWEDELGLKPIGVEDGFFEMGGSSLLAIKITQTVNNFFGIEMELKHFFEHQTIRALAWFIRDTC
jgi:acyl transferase domain-containing protein